MPSLFIPGIVVPKARPRFNTRTGNVYTAPPYAAYLEMARDVVALSTRGDPIPDDIILALEFSEKGVEVTYEPAIHTVEWTSRKGDIDNMGGSIMDALQQGGAITNDKNVVGLNAWVE